MAFVCRRPRSPYWHAGFFGPDGRKVLRSTKQTAKEAAQIMANEFESWAGIAKRGELQSERQAERMVADLMDKVKKENNGKRHKTE